RVAARRGHPLLPRVELVDGGIRPDGGNPARCAGIRRAAARRRRSGVRGRVRTAPAGPVGQPGGPLDDRGALHQRGHPAGRAAVRRGAVGGAAGGHDGGPGHLPAHPRHRTARRTGDRGRVDRPDRRDTAGPDPRRSGAAVAGGADPDAAPPTRRSAADRPDAGVCSVPTRLNESMVSVFLVDDHEVLRRGLIDLLDSDPDLEVVGEAGTVAQAMARIPAAQPDVAVLDVRLPDGNGVELCRDLLARMPDLRCLMLTSYTSDQAMLDAILAGASGYVVKDIKGMELAQAIKDVGAGRSLLDNRAAEALMAKLRGADHQPDPLAGLSDQERVLLSLIGEGLTNKQIAARMFLAEKTVKNYVSRLLAKLGMERRTQAAVFVSKLDRPIDPRG